MEFVSKVEEIMPAKELLFDPTPGFGAYKEFLSHAIAHPAKANTKLLEFLIKKFTKPGDVVLDPMAGTGSTGVVAALHGRNAICVDIEEKFYRWMEKARENVERYPTLTPKGWMKNICGDARQLSELLRQQADTIVTSPPYLRSADKGGGINRQRPQDVKIGCSSVGRVVEHPEAIDNVKGYGSIDAIVTSPPYLDVDNVKRNSEEFWKKTKELGLRWGSKPPAGTVEKLYETPENIAKLRHGDIDANNPQNIGNLDKETYLSAMFKVYREMWKVLKPRGFAIIIVKPFIRGKQVVDLPYHTWLLMQKVGFKLADLYKLRLQQVSFWRILYERKFPEVPKIRHEYVLVCQKPQAEPYVDYCVEGD